LPKLKKLNLPKLGTALETQKTYYSQYKQDKFLNENVFHDKKNGVFVDIGAYDGVECSNTYFFEKNLQWTGICVEPHPLIFQRLKANRKCNTINGCAWTENTKKTYRMIIGESDMLSGLLDNYDPKHLERVNRDATNMKDVDVECIDVNTILEQNNLINIDFLSIDTEGGELEILKHIDFSKYNIQTIAVENQYDPTDVRQFLFSKGYKLLAHVEIDDIFIKENPPTLTQAK
jgi:FkbM family methyltransferase